MKSLLLILYLSSLPLCLAGQDNECSFYVGTDNKHPRKKIRHSLYPLNFTVTESIDVTLNISDKGSRNIIELIFDFNDKGGLPVELGNMLTLNFMDGTSISALARTRKVYSSIVYFTFHHQSSKNDTLLEKLSDMDILSFEITADYEKRKIPIPATKAAILKETI